MTNKTSRVLALVACAVLGLMILRVPTSADAQSVTTSVTSTCVKPSMNTKVTLTQVAKYYQCRSDELLAPDTTSCTFPTTVSNKTLVNYVGCRSDELLAKKPTPSPTPSDTPTVTTNPSPTDTTSAPPPSSQVCTSDNAWTNWNGEKYDWTDNGAGSMGEYYVSADMWGADGTGMTQHSVFCSKTSDGNSPYFYAEASTPADADGSVKSYPNAHLDFHHWGTGVEPSLSDVDADPSTPNVLTSSFTHSGPGACAGCSYDWAQELWLNQYKVEVMIWTQWQTQHPSFAGATLQDTVTLNGHTWEVWRAVWGGTGTSSDGYIVFLPKDGPITHADWNLLNFTDYMQGKGWLGTSPTLSSVTYGVEICETGGATKRFDVTDFNVSPLPHLQY